MTNREFYTAILSNNLSDEVKAFATSAIEKLDARNASRNSKPTKTQVENAPIKDAILAHLVSCGNSLTQMEIGDAVGTTHSKAGALARQLVAEGKVTVGEVKLPKVGTRKVYTAVAN